MLVNDAQHEMRTVYRGGFVGQAVSGVLWLISAALGTWGSVNLGVISLFVLCFFIFPLTQLALKLAGQPATLRSGNPLQSLAKQIAFIVPICLPVIYGAAKYNINWYYPAFMVIVGAHYLPFVFLYGMWQYALLGALLVGGGVGMAVLFPAMFTPGGWFSGIVLILFAIAIRLLSPQDTAILKSESRATT